MLHKAVRLKFNMCNFKLGSRQERKDLANHVREISIISRGKESLASLPWRTRTPQTSPYACFIAYINRSITGFLCAAIVLVEYISCFFGGK